MLISGIFIIWFGLSVLTETIKLWKKMEFQTYIEGKYGTQLNNHSGSVLSGASVLTPRKVQSVGPMKCRRLPVLLI